MRFLFIQEQRNSIAHEYKANTEPNLQDKSQHTATNIEPIQPVLSNFNCASRDLTFAQAGNPRTTLLTVAFSLNRWRRPLELFHFGHICNLIRNSSLFSRQIYSNNNWKPESSVSVNYLVDKVGDSFARWALDSFLFQVVGGVVTLAIVL